MKLLAILGNPVSHSLSPLLHNSAIAALGLKPAVYTRLRIEDGAQLRRIFESHGLSGANVTVPHKEAAFEACDELCALAARIGTVNTIVNEAGRLKGYNTDALGFMEAIAPFGQPKRSLILGAGGTARAIATIFTQQGLACTVLNRSADRLEPFKAMGAETATWQSLPKGPFEMVINTTSAGLSDDALPLDRAILQGYLTSARAAVEVIYGKETPFLKLANAQGIQTQDGLAMLIHQAALAFKLFFPAQEPAQVSTLMYDAATKLRC